VSGDRASGPDRDALDSVWPASLGMKLHHLGVATRSIDADARVLSALGFANEGQDFVDPLQGIRGRFVAAAGVRLELVQALEGSNVLDPWLAARTKIYHQGFLVEDLDAALAGLVRARAKVTRGALPAVAFGGRRVAFAMLPNLMLVELIEAPE
jgi:methylmalonyl-CoA/ethylmalonyl-CoA epimerase